MACTQKGRISAPRLVYFQSQALREGGNVANDAIDAVTPCFSFFCFLLPPLQNLKANN
jgi:hypothetical protein